MAQCEYTIGGGSGNGVRCREVAQPGRRWCSYHRGNLPTGVDHHKTTHGRYSNDMPRELMDRFIAASTDPAILSLTADIALIDTRVGEVLNQLKSGAATSSAVVWDEIEDRLKLRRDLVESERKYLVESGQTITVGQLMLLLRAISVVIKAHVFDGPTLTKIAAGIAELIDASAVQSEFVGFEVAPLPQRYPNGQAGPGVDGPAGRPPAAGPTAGVPSRRWSHTDDEGNPDDGAPVVPIENLDSRLNSSAARNNHHNPVVNGVRVGYNPTSLTTSRSGGLGDRRPPAARDMSKVPVGGTIYGSDLDSKRARDAQRPAPTRDGGPS